MKKHYMHFNETIKSWDEALPLGNGIIGCLIWGDSHSLRLSLDRCDLWDTADAPKIGGEYTYKNLVKMSREGNEKEIERIFDEPYSRPRPTKLPAGRIEIDLKVRDNVKSSLDIMAAEAAVNVGDCVLQGFIDANNEVGIFKIPLNCSYKVINPEFGHIGDDLINDPRFKSEQELHSAQVGNMQNLKYPAPSIVSTEADGIRFDYFIQTTSDKMSYGIFAGSKNGLLVFTVKKAPDRELLVEKALSDIKHAISDGYEWRFTEHKKWWNDYYSKSYITLDDKYFEYNWYLGNYFLGSCSRKGSYPMALQGVWTADNGKLPPWKGDYHHNLNTQITYLSYLKANHLPEGECFVDYLLSLEEKAEQFAREFYEIDEGLCLPSVMDIEGNALGGWPMYAMNPSNIAWLCDSIADLYDYTKDIDFLKDKAYPYIKKFGIFLAKLLERNEEGKLVLPFSSSPEAHDNTAASFLTPNSSYDLALIRNVYEDLVRFADTLGQRDDKARFEGILKELDIIHVDENGSLMISRDEKMYESHHMVSHLMSIHPLRQLDYGKEEEKRIIDASISFYESFGYYLYVGYTFVQRGEMYAIQGNGTKAYEMLKLFWEDFCLQNGFHCNGDYKQKYGMFFTYRPFTLEGNMCAVDLLQEMLLQDHHGKVIIAPAIPQFWKNFSYKMRSKCGAIIEVKVENGNLTSLVATAYADCSFPVYFADKFVSNIELKAGESFTL